MTWAQRLKRVFNIDIETCRECGGAVKVAAPAYPCACGISASMHVIACIEDPLVIEKILTHLNEKPSPQERACCQKAGHRHKLACSAEPKKTNHSTQVTATLAKVARLHGKWYGPTPPPKQPRRPWNCCNG
jgi:hypothetical protein